MALVGVLRPRLIVTRGLVAALTDEELAASIGHEVGHSRARDNLTRLLMRATPDPVDGDTGRASESNAGGHRPRNIAPIGWPPTAARWPAARWRRARQGRATHTGGDTARGADQHADRRRRNRVARRTSACGRHAVRAAPVGPSAGPLLRRAATTAVGYAPALRFVHTVTELLVHSLP
jgi:hypothetical protein